MRFMNQNHDIDELIDNGWKLNKFYNMDGMTFTGEKRLSFTMLNWIHIMNNIYVVDFIHKCNFI